MSNRYSALIGATPAHSLQDVLSTLNRLRRMFDLDDEDLQSRGYEARLVMHTRLELFDALIDYVQPAAEQEAAWDAADRDLQITKDRGIVQTGGWPG